MHITPARGRRAAWIALPLAVVASGAVIASASYASFTATTENAGNSWTTGHVDLADDDKGSALFDVAGLAPGASGENCITVSSGSSVDSLVTMYAKDASGPAALTDQMHLTVQLADDGTACADVATTPVFDGTLTEFNATTDHGSGVAPWSTGTTPSAKVVKISYELLDTAQNDSQDTSAATTFVWEAVSK